MPKPSETPEQRFQTFTAAGETVTFVNGFMGAIIITNDGPNAVFLALGTAVAPVATNGDGRTRLGANSALNIGNGATRQISGRCAAGETANVQMIGWPANSNTQGG